MTTSRLHKILAILAVTALVTGCKLAVVVVEGGHVEALNSPDCLVGTNCVVNVTDTDFSEAFTAVAAPGWQFVKWNSGGGFFCANSFNPTCSLSLAGTAGNAAVEALVASSKTFYIMPVFERLPGGLPITDTITVDGKQWAQPDQFRNLQWRDMNAVCPNAICNGILNGYEMTGWTWASFEHLNALFNYYIGSQHLGPVSGVYDPLELGSGWLDPFWGDGWRVTHDFNPDERFHLPFLAGFIRECSFLRYGEYRAGIASAAVYPYGWYETLRARMLVTQPGDISENASHKDATCETSWALGGLQNTAEIGGWFYRAP